MTKYFKTQKLRYLGGSGGTFVDTLTNLKTCGCVRRDNTTLSSKQHKTAGPFEDLNV